jgi:hypothetical protein
LLLRRIMGNHCGRFVLVVTGQAQTIEWSVQKAVLPLGSLMRIMTTETISLFIGSMNAAAAGLFLVTLKAQFLWRSFQATGIIAGMGSMTGKTISISDRGVLLAVAGIRMWGLVAVSTKLNCSLFQRKWFGIVRIVMTVRTLTLFDRIVDKVTQQMISLR